ncbi:hypothetical protein [Lacrimispora sp. 38-1]|uniref:hypothetical protein n=1 Tax=Lacrimispora sp. 38-1 TaxID=3125778 RepID=UPI003CF84F8E
MVENDLANNLQDTFEADGALMGGTSGMRLGMLEETLKKDISQLVLVYQAMVHVITKDHIVLPLKLI